MDQNRLISIRCPQHPSYFIEALNLDPNTPKLGYCCGCIIESLTKRTLPQNLKTFEDYLKETSDFYDNCRQRVQNSGEPPVQYTEELSEKAERLEKLSKHVDSEKQKVKKKFDEIRKSVLEIIDTKEKECFGLLEAEISGLSELYTQCEKLLKTGWGKFGDDIEATYPTAETLKQKISRIGNMDQLEGFMKEVIEDVNFENLYGEDGLEKRKYKINYQMNCIQRFETCFPAIEDQLMMNLENSMKEPLQEFSSQEVTIKNPLALRMKESPVGSKITDGEQYAVIKSWLPGSNNLDLKLLYRGSDDGMLAQEFHMKCDGQGATVTLIKCRFTGAESSSIIGGFIDQSWHSNHSYTHSNEAFLFSITQGAPLVKCPIGETQKGYAFYGNQNSGPMFGANDLHIKNDFKAGSVHLGSYANAVALRENNESNFVVEEIEVFKVLTKWWLNN